MKHGRKPTVKQCKLMKSWRLNPADWLVTKDTPEEMWLVHRYCPNTTRIIHRENDYEV